MISRHLFKSLGHFLKAITIYFKGDKGDVAFITHDLKYLMFTV